eukprot:TRINITY_DN16868_c0_g1_i1.p1 TRINITY_DN16868_c0_g1~~TRINITY_DN16868_c0_g1_i1.p1  ORF type:complete len:144 (+),score=18.42 TRINITY_DN16868_c0_g1_i1:40-471(+)
MGWNTHIYEAEYYFPEGTTVEEITQKLKEEINNRPRYRLITDPEQIQKLFTRQGQENSVINAYHNKIVKDEHLTIFCTHTTKLCRFVDDMAFTFHLENGNFVCLRGFSISRIGGGDMYQNSRNVNGLLDSQKFNIRDRKVLQE